ncbi:MAG: ABC transporter ATP-binding protein [Anaerolineaceae bacterium]|nr:MAG: ABC transporter ATP-binding protein [Anaerolineaceae bacterium]
MLTISHVSKTYENQPLLTDVSLTVGAGETICLLGASGSGKSTLLRIIAGLEPPEAGRVLWDGADLAPIPPHVRDFGLVFQDYALFPHLTVFENVAFGLRMKSNTKTQKHKDMKQNKRLVSSSLGAFVVNPKLSERVAEVLELVNLTDFGNRRVTDLSGGEQQRVALARALAPHPRLLMFDEPLGALDRTLKEELLHELRAILHRTQIPAIYVTHDQEEAFAIADRILLLHEGIILREGTPADVWSDPQSAWAARFLGVGNVIEGKMNGDGRVETELGFLRPLCKHNHVVGERVALLLRQGRKGGRVARLKMSVEDVLFSREQFEVRLGGGIVIQMVRPPKVGSKILVTFRVECLGHA